MAGFNAYQNLSEEVKKKLTWLGECYSYLHKDSSGNTLRGVLYEVSQESYERACKRLTGEMTGEIITGDKVYVLPNCRIPKFKIEDYVKETGAVLTGDITECTKIIGHDKVWEQAQYQAGGSVLLIEMRSGALQSKFYSMDPSWIAYIKEEEKEKVTQDFNTMVNSAEDLVEGVITNDTILSPKTWNINWRHGFDGGITQKFLITPTGALILYNHILRKIPILNEDLIFERIGKPIALDAESYESIRQMLASEDEDNHKVGAELLSNCDIENSLFWIWKLARFKHEIWHESIGNKVRNLSRFKNIRLFIRMSRWDKLRQMDEEMCIEFLHKKGVLTQEKFDELVPEAAKAYNTLKSPVFKMSVEPGDKYKDFKSNYKLEYTQEPEEEEEIITDEDE